jgi:thiol-disulfide isomerase/thioredoxin
MDRRRFLAGAAATTGVAALPTPARTQQTFRLQDVCMLDPTGRLASTADMRGKVVFLHWWGSWCPPCKRELPELAAMESALKPNDSVRFVFLNGLEHNDRSLAFLKTANLSVSQYNSLNMSRQERNMFRTDGTEVSLNDLGIRLYPQTWIVSRGGLIVKFFAGENRNWGWWQSYVEDEAKKPWDAKTLAPADRLGWASGEYAGGLVGAADERRIRIVVEPGGPDGQAKIAAQWLVPNAGPGRLRAVWATPEAITLAGNFESGNSLRAVATPAGIGGVYQTGTRTKLVRIEMKKAAA